MTKMISLLFKLFVVYYHQYHHFDNPVRMEQGNQMIKHLIKIIFLIELFY